MSRRVVDLPDDVLIEILGFQEPDDLLEATHAHRFFLAAVRLLKPRPTFRGVCQECRHSMKFCLCEKRAKRVGMAYFFFLVALVAFCFAYPFLSK